MIYREIDPELYTVDGREYNSLHDMYDAENTVGEQVVAACNTYNFAVIENTFSATALKTLRLQAAACITEHDVAGSTQRYNTPKAYGIHKTPERRTELQAGAQELLQGVAHGLYRASADSRVMDTPHDTVNTTFITRYLPGGKAASHYDTISGVALETTMDGLVSITVKMGVRNIARVLLGQNMTLVMPGMTFGSRGHKDQAKHSVRNVTPQSEHNGYRLGITYIYGRLSPEERAAQLQSRRLRGTIR
jgi:hypothetical protein